MLHRSLLARPCEAAHSAYTSLLVVLLISVTVSSTAQKPGLESNRNVPGSLAADVAAAPVCAVSISGNAEGGLDTATVACSKGSITAAADNESVLALFQADSAGVNWTADGLGGCGLEGGTCLLAICGISGGGLLGLELKVSGYVGDTETLWGVVCIAGNATVRIKVSYS